MVGGFPCMYPEVVNGINRLVGEPAYCQRWGSCSCSWKTKDVSLSLIYINLPPNCHVYVLAFAGVKLPGTINFRGESPLPVHI